MINKQILPFEQAPQLAKSDIAYATGDARLHEFYLYEPSMSSFAEILLRKEQSEYPRADLVEALKKQYATLPSIPIVDNNINALSDSNTFTIVTAHQPSLFLGPMYFIYKALSVIKLADTVQKRAGDKRKIVPVFVMGSEDHDLEELNKIRLFSKQIEWQPGETGPVGIMRAETLATPLEELKGILGDSEAAQTLYQRVERACLGRATFAEATQALLHEFLGRLGIVVLDMNEPTLKRHLISVMRDELLFQHAHSIVNATIARLTNAGFKPQAAPREINLFYLTDQHRERIILEDGLYKILNSTTSFTQAEILNELEKHPERFSPNVVLRPLYQELILPNLAYVGGGGEIAYWLERRNLFQHFGIQFPMLVRRHSVLWMDRDSSKKLARLNMAPTDLFQDIDALIRQYIQQHASGEVSLADEIANAQELFERMAQKAAVIDPTLEKSVMADWVKTKSSLEQWQGRLVRAEKQKHETSLNQLRTLRERFFPNNGLQERSDNFLGFVLKYGDDFFDLLLEKFEPFDPGFLVLTEQ